MKKGVAVFRIILIFLLFFNPLHNKAQKFEKLAQTPPMGWNSWNKFACNVSEKLIRDVADALVSSGMKDAGYTYVVIDDCWHGKRDSLGFIQADTERFPSGIKALADYIHSKGLKFGIYSCAGDKTCGGRPGSRGYEYQDALQYAQWGVDYLKYDWCYTEGLNAVGAYTTMAQALVSAGRPIVFSLCEWGGNKPWDWGPKLGHLWRTTGDIYDCFDCVIDHGTWKSWGVMKILDQQDGLRKYAGPGRWNDPDMLEVGNGGMTINEDRAHFSMWCMIAAPLIAGNDIVNMKPETKEILTNAGVIAINQDSLGIQGFKYSTKDSIETWVKPLKGGDWAVCFLNRSVKSQKVQFNWATEKVTDEINKLEFNPVQVSYKLINLWTKAEIGTTQKPLIGEIPAHDVLMLRLTAVKVKNKK
jgi:alpha-galactosidase